MSKKKVKTGKNKTFEYEEKFWEEMEKKYGLSGLEWTETESKNKQQDPKRQ